MWRLGKMWRETAAMINDNGKRNRPGSSPIAGSINIDAKHFRTLSEAVTTLIRHEAKFRFMFGIINSICRDYFDDWCMCAIDWSHFQRFSLVPIKLACGLLLWFRWSVNACRLVPGWIGNESPFDKTRRCPEGWEFQRLIASTQQAGNLNKSKLSGNYRDARSRIYRRWWRCGNENWSKWGTSGRFERNLINIELFTSLESSVCSAKFLILASGGSFQNEFYFELILSTNASLECTQQPAL